MNCTSARELFPALLDQRTAATAHLDARAHLGSCPDCQREFAALSQTLAALDAMPTPAPSPRLRKNFYAMLEEEKHSAASIRASAKREHRISLVRWLLAPAGLAAAVAIGYFAGQRSGAPAGFAQTNETQVLRTELTAMRTQLEKTNDQLLKYSALMARSLVERLDEQQQGPTSERFREVLAAAKLPNPSQKDLSALVDALAFDPSTNIRLRALEALFEHSEKAEVRSGVISALNREQNPLVQLEMIEFVANAHDRNATPILEKLSQSEQVDRAVRAAASRALTQL